MEKSKIRHVESRHGEQSPKEVSEEMDQINKAFLEMRRLVLSGEATLEIKKNDSGNKVAIVKHGDEIIHSTDFPVNVESFEMFLENPQATIDELLKRKQINAVEKAFYDDLANPTEKKES